MGAGSSGGSQLGAGSSGGSPLVSSSSGSQPTACASYVGGPVPSSTGFDASAMPVVVSNGPVTVPSTKGFVAYDANSTGISRDIFVTTADGSCRRQLVGSPATEKQPAFSPDGGKLAYASDATGVFQIYILDIATGLTRQMTNEPGGATYPAFSPGGTELAFVSGDPEGDTGSGSGVLEILDLATGVVRPVLPPYGQPWLSPEFASDTLVLTGSGSALVAYHLDTNTSCAVVPLNGRIPNPRDPSPAPDGIRYVFSDFCGDAPQLYIGRIDGSTGDTCLGAFRLATVDGGVESPDWGPFGMIAGETKDGRILLFPEDGSAPLPLVSGGPARNPAFAPATFTQSCP